MSGHETKKYISLNNFGSKHIKVIKFGKFMSNYEIKSFYQKVLQKMWPGIQFLDLFVIKDIPRFLFTED